jgi:hypothetical protein
VCIPISRRIQEAAPQPYQQYVFSQPQRFLPQCYELYWVREKLRRLRSVERSAPALG